MRRVIVVALFALLALAPAGCAQSPTVAVSTPTYSPTAAVTKVVDAPPATAEQYYAKALRGGVPVTPEPGTKLRTALMDAARQHFALSCKFYVHSLSVDEEVAQGTIEPYPTGTGEIRNVTWVLWQGKWAVVSGASGNSQTARVASPPSGQSSNYSGTSSGGYSAGGGSSYYGDANGDGDSGVLSPSVPIGANPSDDWTGQNTEWHWVNGYTRSDGTYVSGHYRRTE